MKKITVLIPCYNEEQGIGKVLEAMPHAEATRLGFSLEIIVIDNNCTDKTAEVAKSFKAKVLHESNKGKGNAMLAGFKAVSKDSEYVVMLDGDNTYKPLEMFRLIEPLYNNFCDVVVGSRLGGKINQKAFKLQNRIANWGYTFLVRQIYRANVTDVLSGYFAWKKKVIDDLIPNIESTGFSIEMEMLTKMVKLGHEVVSVPITYDKREGETKIESLKDGVKILQMFFKNLVWKPTYNQSEIKLGNYTTAEPQAILESNNE